MDRMRPVHVRQKSITGQGVPSSPLMSPMQQRHARTGSTGTLNSKKAQNIATKAAAQRLAQVMAHQSADEDEDDDDDLSFDYTANPTGSIGLAAGRAMRSHSPLSVRTFQEQPSSVRLAAGGRSSLSVNSVEQPSSARSNSAARTSSQPISSVEQPPPARLTTAVRTSSQPISSVDQPPSARSTSAARTSSLPINSLEQPPSARSTIAGRTSPSINSIDQPPSAHSTPAGRPSLGIKTVPMVPPTVPLSVRLTTTAIPAEALVDNRRDKRLSLDLGTLNFREAGNQNSSSALQDELDMLQEENENLLEKLRLAEERCDEADARARQLEKQVATLGEGVSLEARLLSRLL